MIPAGTVVGTDPNGREITAGDCRASTTECRDGLSYLQADRASRRWTFSVGKGIECLKAGECHCTIQREYDGRCWSDESPSGTGVESESGGTPVEVLVATEEVTTLTLANTQGSATSSARVLFSWFLFLLAVWWVTGGLR